MVDGVSFPRSAEALSSVLAKSGSAQARAAEKAAEDLLVEYRRTHACFEIPVNLELLATSLRTRVEVVRSLEGEGRLLPNKAGFTILVNHSTPFRRRRVSIAHELAHTLFYDSERGNRRVIPATPEEERFCFEVGRRLRRLRG